MYRYLFLDDRVVDASEAGVSPLDPGFLFGEGVFETFATWGGVPFRLHAHVRRLRRGAREIGADPGSRYSVGRFAAIVRDLREANGIGDAAFRITVTPGVGEPARSARRPTVVVHARPLPEIGDPLIRGGVDLGIAPYRRDPANRRYRLKSTSYLDFRRVRAQAREAGLWDSVFANEDGSLAEGSCCNLFLVRGGVVRTPGILSGILPGILRESILLLARREGVAVQEGVVMRGELARASEAFVTNALIGILPVRSLDGLSLPTAPGDFTRRLGGALLRRIRSCVARLGGSEADLDARIPHEIT